MSKQEQGRPRAGQVIAPAGEGDATPRIHVYYGYGKGKTTCCMGLVLRSLGAGRRVALVQFDKGYDGENEHYSERTILRTLKNVSLHPTGCERMLPDGSFRFGVEPADVKEATRGLRIARDLVTGGNQDLLVLDEILAAVAYKLVGREEVMSLLDAYDSERRCELVLSGHQVWPELIDRVDLVTQMKKIKHYYDAGTPARLGIEF